MVVEYNVGNHIQQSRQTYVIIPENNINTFSLISSIKEKPYQNIVVNNYIQLIVLDWVLLSLL